MNFHFWMNFSLNPLTNCSNPASVTLSDKENHVHTSPLCAITLFFTMRCSKGQTPSWFITEFHLFLAFCLSLPPLLYVTNRVRASQLRAALWRRSAKRGSLVKLKCPLLRIDNADDEQSGGKQEEKRATVRNETSPKPNEIFRDFHKESSCSLSHSHSLMNTLICGINRFINDAVWFMGRRGEREFNHTFEEEKWKLSFNWRAD